MPKCECVNPIFMDRADVEQVTSPVGNPELTYETFKTNIPGRLISIGGDETFRGKQLEAKISHVYECRYVPGVVATMRLRMTAGIFKGRVLNIDFANIVRKPGTVPMYELRCVELAATE